MTWSSLPLAACAACVLEFRSRSLLQSWPSTTTFRRFRSLSVLLIDVFCSSIQEFNFQFCWWVCSETVLSSWLSRLGCHFCAGIPWWIAHLDPSCFQSSSLLMHEAGQWKTVQVLGPCLHGGVQDRVPGSWLWAGPDVLLTPAGK